MLKPSRFPTNQRCFRCWFPDSLKDSFFAGKDTKWNEILHTIGGSSDSEKNTLTFRACDILSKYKTMLRKPVSPSSLWWVFLPLFYCFIWFSPKYFLFFIFNIQRRRLLQLGVVNYFHNMLHALFQNMFYFKQGSEYASVSSNHPNSALSEQN